VGRLTSADANDQPMNKSQRLLTAALVLVGCALLVVVGQAAWQTFRSWSGQPLGGAVPTSPFTPLGLPPTWTPAATQSLSVRPAVSPDGTAAAPRCGGPAVMNILLIGSDTRGSGYTWGLADVIRIVRVDFVSPRVTTLDFPRDLWVEIPYVSDDLGGQDHEKLNQAYLYGNPGDGFKYWDDPSAGPGLLALTLGVNFGAKVDHYLAINMQTFVRMVDAVGGIDVTVPESVPGSHNPDLQSGMHHLDGAEALALARNRADGVFSRGLEQNAVLCGLQRKLTNPSVVPQIPALIRSFQGSVQTDLSPDLMGKLACLATQTPRGNITMYSFPESLFTSTRVHDPVFPEQKKGVSTWDVDFLVLRNFVAQFQAGSWPESAGDEGSSPTSTFCE
jgi:LCP family protein required for cell wall assembly